MAERKILTSRMTFSIPNSMEGLQNLNNILDYLRGPYTKVELVARDDDEFVFHIYSVED